MTLEKHVLARVKSDARSDKQALESVLLKMGGNISVTAFQSWNRIFKRSIDRKEIIVSWDKDETGDHVSSQTGAVGATGWLRSGRERAELPWR